jgi:hypothetical protein
VPGLVSGVIPDHGCDHGRHQRIARDIPEDPGDQRLGHAREEQPNQGLAQGSFMLLHDLFDQRIEARPPEDSPPNTKVRFHLRGEDLDKESVPPFIAINAEGIQALLLGEADRRPPLGDQRTGRVDVPELQHSGELKVRQEAVCEDPLAQARILCNALVLRERDELGGEREPSEGFVPDGPGSDPALLIPHAEGSSIRGLLPALARRHFHLQRSSGEDVRDLGLIAQGYWRTSTPIEQCSPQKSE